MRQSTKLVALAAFVLCMAGFLVLIYRKKIPEPVSAAPVGIQLREQEKYMKLAAQFVPSGFDESQAISPVNPATSATSSANALIVRSSPLPIFI